MKFDIKAHLQNHAYYFKQKKEISKNDLHFNFSYLDLQFFNSVQPPEKTLFELLEELKKTAEYKVRNGYYIDKNGNKKQKYTTRKINLQDAIKIEAIHIEGSEGEYTMPHIHLILDKDARLGKDFSLLKTHIIEVSKKFGLRPNFAEVAPNKNPASYKNLAKAIKNFSWIIRKMPNEDFKKYVANRLEDKLNKLWEYTLLSGNLQYYIKTLEFIKKRLNRQRIDFTYKGHNLRNTYPIPLTEQDLQVIELINKKKFSQKDLKPHLNNAILRDFVRYSYFKDKDKALIINSLSKQTHLLENLRPNKKVVENYLKLYQKTLNLDKQQQIEEQQKEKEIKSIKEILKEDLLKVAKSSINEKELREKMKALGYEEFGFKKKSGKVIGYQFKLPQENKKIVVKCADSIDIKEIRAILKENWIKSKTNEPIQSNISNEQSKINTYLLPKPFEPPKALPIPYKTKQIEEQKEKQRQRRKYEREYTRTIENITRYIERARENSKRERRDKETIRFKLKRELANKRAITELAKRKYRIENEDKIIREQTANLRERIRNTIKSFASAITNRIRESFKRIKQQKLINFVAKNLTFLTNENKKYIHLYDKFLDYIDKNNIQYDNKSDKEKLKMFAKYLLEVEKLTKQDIQKDIEETKIQKAKEQEFKKQLQNQNNDNYLSL